MPTTVNASENDDVCSICYEELSMKRIICLHPCEHQFHRTCIMSWFESRQVRFLHISVPTTPVTCCLCRAYASRHNDENGQHVPPMLALEDKETEHDFAFGRFRPTGLVKFWISINGILESLKEDKLRSFRNDKCNEYITDIDEEIEKLRKRADLAEKIFVSHSLRMNHKMNELNENIRSLVEIIDQGERTTNQLILLEKNLARANSELRVEKDAATTTAIARFRELCEAAIAAAAAARALCATVNRLH